MVEGPPCKRPSQPRQCSKDVLCMSKVVYCSGFQNKQFLNTQLPTMGFDDGISCTAVWLLTCMGCINTIIKKIHLVYTTK